MTAQEAKFISLNNLGGIMKMIRKAVEKNDYDTSIGMVDYYNAASVSVTPKQKEALEQLGYKVYLYEEPKSENYPADASISWGD